MVALAEFVRLVLDPTRLAVLGAASAAGPVDVDDLAGALDVDRRTVLEALGQLRLAGLIGEDARLEPAALQSVAASLPRPEPVAAEILSGSWTNDEAELLARFFTGNRLVEVPSARNKRVVVLERMAQEFEPGLRYEEAEVNFTLQLFHPDYAALRRYLVDEGFLTRADGVYWRTGGRTSDA